MRIMPPGPDLSGLFMKKLSIQIFAVLFLFSGVTAAKPIVIAHRGASGYLPEHTLAAYRLAIEMGADYIEPDLVLTKDGIFVARHEHYLSRTTDIADHPEFLVRRKQVGERTDWFVEDFTRAELSLLKTRQAVTGRSAEHDGKHGIPTFQEVIDLVKAELARTGRSIGLYPETKEPGHFGKLGFDVASLLLDILEKNDLNSPNAKIFVQSFEPQILRSLNGRIKVPLVQLVMPVKNSQGQYQSNIPLATLSEYAQVVAPMKWLLIDRNREANGFLRQARDLGLLVHVWTFRDDSFRADVFADGEKEIEVFLKLGVDGVFTDFPDTGVKVRDAVVGDAQSRAGF